LTITANYRRAVPALAAGLALAAASFSPASKDGTHRGAVVMTLVCGARAWTVIAGASATLSANRTRGSVSATTLTGQPMSASFHC
jgi:hypothetical protein